MNIAGGILMCFLCPEELKNTFKIWRRTSSKSQAISDSGRLTFSGKKYVYCIFLLFLFFPLLNFNIETFNISHIKYLALFTLLLLKTNIKGLLKYQQDMKFQTFVLGKR